MTEQYYTATEAQQKLGLSKAMFFRKVKQGFIRKIVPPGMKQGVYPKRDIDALALSMYQAFEQDDVISFSRSTIADQVEEMDIGIRYFGRDFITPLPERIAFQQKNEFTFHSLKAHGHVVGYISMFRFSDAFLDQLLTGRYVERDITVREVLPFVRLEPFHIYIDVMAVDPSVPHHLKDLYVGLLVSHIIDLILNLRNNGYLIEKIYTVGTTKEADSLVRQLGFQPMEHKSLDPGRTAYEFLLNEEGIRSLQAFRNRSSLFNEAKEVARERRAIAAG